ncbi:uncharacterized protein TM35_000051380 [Trypanosoma theileri]|uniref:Uncharacterized protein n=1 Tax=Trypanosoma theileri TaxID=67003 RepID=A0A1X0P3N9_9TRYP|nr:uncharacterized protein TM35_000051380 [Trypanosoma theileri]ORC91542.1 hypothetical protein TM35_000051380 [Trypanosoma theileri]
MPLKPQPQPQPRPSGKRTPCVLSRPPAPPPLGPEAGMAVVGSRVSRLLRDARAAVQQRHRPDTPPITTTTTAAAAAAVRRQPLPLPKRGIRLTAMLTSTPSETSQLVTSAQQLDKASFESSLDAVKGVPSAQLEKLGELKRWLVNPQHLLWDSVVTRLVEMVLMPSTDVRVVISAVSILLRYNYVNSFPSLPVVVRRLHELCEGGMEKQLLEDILMRESLLQPLLHLLTNEELLFHQPGVLWDVLETLRSCSANSDVILTQLVTLGVIPNLNTVLQRILTFSGNSPSKSFTSSDSSLHTLIPPLCLIYRNLSTEYSHHLRKLGSLDLIISVLEQFRGDDDVVQAAARAMAKTVFDDGCLEHYQDGTRACNAVVGSLEASIDVGGLSVSRLCGALARLVEGSRELRDWLMHHHQRMLIRLVRRYIAPLPSKQEEKEDETTKDTKEGTTTEGVVDLSPDMEDAELDDLLQSITWLIGVAAVSAECSPDFVLEITPLLVSFLKNLDMNKKRLTFILTLMCMSNLSFFFDALDKTEKGHEALVDIYATVGFILAGVLFDGDTEATVEATRILGNMSLTNAGRDWMETNRCDEVCIVFLGHEDPRIVYNCFGVLLNLTAADSCRVASDQQLLSMLLQHTGRYTREDCIAAEKARECSRRGVVAGAAGRAGGSSGDGEAMEDLRYIDQIADVVEKLLLNLSALI